MEKEKEEEEKPLDFEPDGHEDLESTRHMPTCSDWHLSFSTPSSSPSSSSLFSHMTRGVELCRNNLSVQAKGSAP